MPPSFSQNRRDSAPCKSSFDRSHRKSRHQLYQFGSNSVMCSYKAHYGKWTIYCSTNQGRRVCEIYIGGYERSSWPETTRVLVSPAVHFSYWSIAHRFADSLTRAASRLASGGKEMGRSAGLGFGIESHRPRNSSGSARHGRACMTRVLPRAFSLPSNAHGLEAAGPLAIFSRRPRLEALKTQRARCRPGPTVMRRPSVRPATSRSICGLQPADPHLRPI